MNDEVKEFRYTQNTTADDWSSFVLFVSRIRAHFIYLFHYSWFHLQHQQNKHILASRHQRRRRHCHTDEWI